MSFLDRLESWGVKADQLMLNGYPDVTGSITVPITGNWDVYQWVDGRLGLPLDAGLHTLRLFSVQQSFRIDKLRFVATAPATACNSGASRPYQGPPVNGNPIAVPATGATFEAEHFNCGGEGQAFHDLVAGVNAGQPAEVRSWTV
jgi:hypothetical protein